ncbi:helix-turn-helix domain-containing protein [Paenibacillus sp. GD4]|uniref:helix-turn-helix domain-containing protein n=1 Tax=Paenibacillus sp. GD4 TaxID=3068890 RepID=UPI002796737E|nr:helix-turn-helix domain-containing protein [Paenibacillus sp. GD4]MDQ1912569.1 helix-turn-helix domain-containing protein [Paenibacillus sp. GD4]
MPKYLYRLLVFTLLLCAVPVVMTGIISYFIASRDIERKVNEGNVQLLLQNQMRMEQALKNVEMGAVQYVNSSLMSDYLYRDLSSDDFQIITDMSKGLYNLHSIWGVADAQIINLEHDWMISNLGFTSLQEFPDRSLLNEYARRPENLFWLAESSGRKPVEDTVDAGGRELVRLVVKLPMIASTRVPKALLIIDMSHSTLESDLAPNFQWGSTYVLNREREPFLSSPGGGSGHKQILQQLGKQTASENYYEQDGMAVNYRISPQYGWSYVSIVSIEEITKESRKIAVITANACFIIFAVIAVAAFYGTRRMYKPIRRLFIIMEQWGGDLPSLKKKDEFAFIEDRFQSLFSTRKHMQQQLQAQRGQVKEFFLLKLFMGQVTESEFLFKSEAYGFGKRGKPLGVLALQIDTLEGTRYSESDKELLLFAINNIVGELIPGECIVGTLLLDQSQVTLLTGNTNEPEALSVYLHEMAEQIRLKLRELLQLKVSIGISRPFQHYTDAMDAYVEALEALKRRISLGHELILSYEDIEEVNSDTVLSSASWSHLEDCFINALRTGDSKAVYDYYQQYATSILERNVLFNDFQMLMIQLISRIYRLLHQQGGSLDGLTGTKSVLNKFMKLSTAEEIVNWFKTTLLPPTIAFLQSRIDTQYINIAHQLVEMIHEQYDRDLSLESCAEQLKYHPVYLSRVFKKEIGVTFIDYLTGYRMNMAKLWLKDSQLKITEIAERLNYTSSTGFIRTFRKAAGMTPGQYRELHSKTDS